MKREEIKAIVEGISDEQLKKILDINSADIGKAKGDVSSLEQKIETLTKDKSDLESKINELTEQSELSKATKKELEDLKKEIADKKAAEEKEAEIIKLTNVFRCDILKKSF